MNLEERYNKALDFIKSPPEGYPEIDLDNK